MPAKRDLTLRFATIVLALWLTACPQLYASTDSEGQEVAETISYPVGRLTFRYVNDHPQHPNLEPLKDLKVALRVEEGCYHSDEEAGPSIDICNPGVEPAIKELAPSAIIAIAKAVVEFFNEHDIVGVFVTVDPADISASGVDLRRKGETNLHFLIYTTSIGRISTVALGCRFSEEEAEDNPAYSHIAVCSPLQGPCSDDPEARGDLLSKCAIDRYLYHLGRYPGRQAAVDIAPTEVPGIIDLTYRIHEDRPLKVYATAANTGSQNKYPWMQTFGIVHYHLTGDDDLFTVEYKTTNFQDMHFVRGYYERPLGCCSRCRLFLEGIWSDFVAAEFGTFEFDDEFSGTQRKVSLGGICNVWQCDDLFFDIRASVDWFDVAVTNRIAATHGETQFVIPRVMVIAERKRQTSKLFASVGIEGNLPNLAGTDREELPFLGRQTEDVWFYILRGSFYGSVYLNRWLCPACDCENPDFCEHAARPKLQHEIALLVDGQFAFNRRLIPQLERTIGGLYTVRGYPQSLTSGADVVYGQLEYRHHLPTLFDCWHVLGRLFLDAGRTVFNRSLPTEPARGLSSVGFGVQGEFKTNIRARADVGFALEEHHDLHIERGHTQVFTSVTVIY